MKHIFTKCWSLYEETRKSSTKDAKRKLEDLEGSAGTSAGTSSAPADQLAANTSAPAAGSLAVTAQSLVALNICEHAE